MQFVVNKTLTATFYRQNSGFFLLLFVLFFEAVASSVWRGIAGAGMSGADKSRSGGRSSGAVAACGGAMGILCAAPSWSSDGPRLSRPATISSERRAGCGGRYEAV